MNPNSTELMQAFVVSHGDARFESGLTEGSTNGLLVGLVVGAIFVAGLVLLGVSRSSVDVSYSAHLGAIPQPQTRSMVAPVIAQGATVDSSSTNWRF